MCEYMFLRTKVCRRIFLTITLLARQPTNTVATCDTSSQWHVDVDLITAALLLGGNATHLFGLEYPRDKTRNNVPPVHSDGSLREERKREDCD